jgi:hypothetical protein
MVIVNKSHSVASNALIQSTLDRDDTRRFFEVECDPFKEHFAVKLARSLRFKHKASRARRRVYL